MIVWNYVDIQFQGTLDYNSGLGYYTILTPSYYPVSHILPYDQEIITRSSC